jgi:hypothetical protein
MFDPLEKLESAARDFRREAEHDFIDPKRLAALIDGLQGELCTVLDRARKRGDHLLTGQSASSWVATVCGISKTAASGRLRVGEQLQSMPKVAEALSSGQIGYQATSVICHLEERVSEVDSHIDEEMWIGNARKFSLKDLTGIAAGAWHAVDPGGFCLAVEEDFERRQLFISETSGMFRVDGWLDPEGGSALSSSLPQSADRRAGQTTWRTRPALCSTAPSRRADRAHPPRHAGRHHAAAQPSPAAHQPQHHAGRLER